MKENIVKNGVLDDGILYKDEEFDDISCSTIDVTTEKAAEIAGRDIGTYITIEFGKIWLKSNSEFQNLVDLVAKKITELSNFRKNGSVLIVGLGNIYITSDSLGPKVLSKVIITRHLKEQIPALYKEFGNIDIAGIAPGVLGQTGMESAEIVLSLSEKIKPSLIIVIDALSSRKLSRLATTIQLSNTGISPGSGVGNNRKALNKQYLGTEVISIGVPTVVDAATLAYDVLEKTCMENNIAPDERLTHQILKKTLEKGNGNFFVTPKENDIIINEVSKVIGYAVNRAFYDTLSFDDMARLV